MSSGFEIISVSQLNYYVKSQLDGDPMLSNVFLRGEISNFTNHYRSGHLYMSLKDEKAVIKAVMFKNSARYLKFNPENGMKVIAMGRASLFDRDGSFQFYIDDLQPDGVGALNIAFEQLKTKLAAKGYFDDCFKKTIPKYPQTVGVVTSPTGAVIQDIRNVLKRRWPLAKIILMPCKVQGIDAPDEIVKSIEDLDKEHICDAIIVARGGGSLEDLSAFNSEIVANAIFNCDTPIISAVGHETDFTISDFVADLRAPTPSAAAELVSKNITDVKNNLDSLNNKLNTSLSDMIKNEEQRLDGFTSRGSLSNPENLFNPYKTRFNNIETKLVIEYKSNIKDFENKLLSNASKLDTLSPLKVLARGYTITQKDNKIIDSISNLNHGDIIKVLYHDGEADCKVENTLERTKI